MAGNGRFIPFPGRWKVVPSLALLLVLALSASGASIRLAVVGGENNRAVSQLEALLSRSDKLEALERAELSRIVDEKRLTGLLHGKHLAALGGVLSADGLLIFEKLRLPGGGERETARLVSTRNGACLLFLVLPEGDDWVEGFVREVEQAVPATALTPSEALPVSFLNLRASMMSPRSQELEAALARLMEIRLASVPDAVFLERRRLGDAGFERSLEAADLPSLREAAVVIDGSLEGPRADGSVEARVRVRDASGNVVGDLEGVGKIDDLADLADRLSAGVSDRVLGKHTSPGESIEPDQLVNEAVWACRSGRLDLAWESLAAARLLGHRSPDASALAVWLVLDRTAPAEERGGGHLSAEDLLPPEVRAGLLNEALTEFLAFRSAGKAVRISGSLGARLRAGSLQHALVERCSDFLRRNDESGAPVEVETMRRLIREIAGMDPDGSGMPYSLAMSSRHARDWAANGTELLRYYEKLLRSDHKWLSSLIKYFPADASAALGPRFRNDAGLVKDWAAMWRRLLEDPKTRLRALLILSRNDNDPRHENHYREYLTEVGRQGAALFEGGQLGAFLEPDGQGRGIHGKYQAERAVLFATLCRTLPGFESTLFSLVAQLKIPPDQRQPVWDAFAAYRARCLAAAPAEKRGDWERSFVHWSGLLRRNNPELASEPVDPGRSLAVRRYWNAYSAPEARRGRYVFRDIVSAGDAVWIIGTNGGTQEVRAVDIPSLATRRLIGEGVQGAAALEVHSGTVWVTTDTFPGDGRPMESHLVRIDLRSGERAEIALPMSGAVTIVQGRIFLRFGTLHDGNRGGLAEIDPVTGDADVLVSARRNPGRSPFDNLPGLAVGGVLEGPGKGLSMVLREPNGLYQLGGDWNKLADTFWADALRFGSASLLVGARGDAILVDPALPAPVVWLSDPKTPSGAARWSLPGGRMDLRGAQAAFRENELFVIERDGSGRHALRWWFAEGPREGVSIPLAFALPEADAAVIDGLRGELADHIVTVEGIRDPHRVSFPLRILATDSGLVLHHDGNGFWFVPNADLEAWRSGHSQPEESSP